MERLVKATKWIEQQQDCQAWLNGRNASAAKELMLTSCWLLTFSSLSASALMSMTSWCCCNQRR